MPELADVFRVHGPAYMKKYGERMLPSHKRTMQDIVRCRTGELGGTTYYCPECTAFHFSFHSCKNRHCPKCQNDAADDWIAMQQEKLTPVPYFMITVTLPSELRRTARSHQKTVYRLFFQTSAEAIHLLAKDPRFLGGEIGLIGVLQTWTRSMEYHPHIHYLVPGVALSEDHKSLLSAKPDFLMPAKPLAAIFKGKFRDALKKAGLFDSVPKNVWEKDWVIDIEPVGDGEAAVKYPAPYIFRVAISNRNILSIKEGQVTFRYKDSKTQEIQFRTLPAQRFISLFLQHVLPGGFIKVRYFGFYASTKKHILEIVKELSAVRPVKKEQSAKPAKIFKCPGCGKPMIAVQDIPAKRGPPFLMPFSQYNEANLK